MAADDTAADDSTALLAVLQVRGQQFLNLFPSPPRGPKKKKRKLEQPTDRNSDDDGDEWNGFTIDTTVIEPRSEVESPAELSKGDEECTDNDEIGEVPLEGTSEQEDDEFNSNLPTKEANVILFSEAALKSASGPPPPTKAQIRAFMSSKITRIRDDALSGTIASTTQDDGVEYEEERSNMQNDALLHRLVHTKLLSASLNPELELTAAQRKKALAGRVLELAGAAKLGKGETLVRREEHNQASKRVRLGMARKRGERNAKELEEAKHLGNYHHSIKGLFEASSSGPENSRKRLKGLKMGVGKFSGGVLKLSRDEIASVQESSFPSRGGRGRGRGGRGGRGANGRGRGRGGG